MVFITDGQARPIRHGFRIRSFGTDAAVVGDSSRGGVLTNRRLLSGDGLGQVQGGVVEGFFDVGQLVFQQAQRRGRGFIVAQP
jgi:hypothetical protein